MPRFEELPSSHRFDTCMDLTSGSATRFGKTIDMFHSRSATFLLHVGDQAPGAVSSIHIQHGDQPDLSDAEDIAGSSVPVLTIAETINWIQIFQPTKRYHRLVMVKDGVNATEEAGIVIFGNNYNVPVIHPSNVTGKRLIGPMSGTP